MLFQTFPFYCVSLDFVNIREVESRARQAEERFDDVNERLHYTLIRNKELEKELEEVLMKYKVKESEVEEEENEAEREEEKEEEEEEIRPQDRPSKSPKKGEHCFLIFASFGEGNGNPLQYSCLENPMDGGAWWATVHGSQRVGHN